jgi:hypothetical protein
MVVQSEENKTFSADVFSGAITMKVKVKVKLPLCLTKHHSMKKYWVSGGITPRILDFGDRWR